MNNEVTLNRLSDNKIKLIITDNNNNIINPNYKWFKIYIKCGGKIFKAISDPFNKEYINCNICDDSLILNIPSKKLGIGIIEYMIESRNNDNSFSDNFKNIFLLKYNHTNINVI